MTNVTSFHKPAKIHRYDYGLAASIIDQLCDKLRGNNETIARGVLNCVNSGTPNIKIIKEIKEMAESNYGTMATIIGNPLLTTIINF